MSASKEIVRLAAVGDLHCNRASAGVLQPLFAHLAEQADILLLCGDLCDYGLPEEAHILAHELTAAHHIPTVAVLGNHDYETGRHKEITDILCEAGVQMLDGEAVEVAGIGFAGVKGFCGGFGSRTLAAWGEEAVKHFVKEGMNEALKLELALARLRTPQRVALLHYAPVRATVEGEPLEIFPFLGTSRLEEPINRYEVTAVFHGHAHRGTPEGKTSAGIPVYNVALPLLRARFAERPPYRLVEIRVGAPEGGGDGTAPQGLAERPERTPPAARTP